MKPALPNARFGLLTGCPLPRVPGLASGAPQRLSDSAPGPEKAVVIRQAGRHHVKPWRDIASLWGAGGQIWRSRNSSALSCFSALAKSLEGRELGRVRDAPLA